MRAIQQTSSSRRLWVAAACLSVSLGGASTATAAEPSDPYEAYGDFAAANNHVAPLETAAAHSNNRFNVAAGVKLTDLPPLPVDDFAAHMRPARGRAGKHTLALPQLWLNKGVYYPFDVGLSYGVVDGSSLSQAAGYIQWTAYEAFAHPALALRATYGRTFGLSQVEVAAYGLQALTSWGYRFVSVYGGISGEYIQLRLRHAERSPGTANRLAFTRLWGLHLQLIPGFLYNVTDFQLAANGQRTITAKFGVEL